MILDACSNKSAGRFFRSVIAVLVIAFWFTRAADAATVPARLPGNVTYNAGAYSVKGTAAGGAVGAASTVSIGGGASASISVGYRLGELAGVAARTAIRANAVMLGTQIVLDWLLPLGIKKCESSGWCTTGTAETAPNGKPYPASDYAAVALGTGQTIYGTGQAMCQALVDDQNARGVGVHTTLTGVNVYATTYGCVRLRADNGQTFESIGQVQRYTQGTCFQAGSTLVNGQCVPPGYVPASPSSPAVDTDWAKVPTTGIPDTVLTAVMEQGNQFLPATPEVSTQVQTVPLSNVYKDPTTGTSFRDYAYVTPTPGDPQTANLQVVKTQVDATTGNPVTDPNTGTTTGTLKQEDPCVANPNRVGCLDKGDIPANPDLLKSEKTITITPDTGWGADTAACPADIVVGLRSRGAQPAVFSYQPVCKAADMFRPVVIGMAWLAAVLIALGVGRRGD